jgi:hypothetical protein
MARKISDQRMVDGVKVFGGCLLLISAAVAGYVDLTNNYKFGSSISAELGIIMGLAAFALSTLPACRAMLGGAVKVVLTCGIWISFIATVIAALSAHLDKQAVDRLHREAITGKFETAKQAADEAKADLERAEREVEHAGETAPSADLRKLADQADADATREAGNKFCGNLCQTYRAKATAFRERAGKAAAREDALARAESARARLREARGDGSAGRAEVSSLAVQAAKKTGRSIDEAASDVELLIAVICIALTVSLALLGEPAVHLIRDGLSRKRRFEIELKAEPISLLAHSVDVVMNGPAANKRGRKPLTVDDRIGQFIEKKLAPGSGEVGGAQLYAAFEAWWAKTCPGQAVPANNVVSARVKAAGIKKSRRTKGTVYAAALLN